MARRRKPSGVRSPTQQHFPPGEQKASSQESCLAVYDPWIVLAAIYTPHSEKQETFWLQWTYLCVYDTAGKVVSWTNKFLRQQNVQIEAFPEHLPSLQLLVYFTSWVIFFLWNVEVICHEERINVWWLCKLKPISHKENETRIHYTFKQISLLALRIQVKDYCLLLPHQILVQYTVSKTDQLTAFCVCNSIQFIYVAPSHLYTWKVSK